MQHTRVDNSSKRTCIHQHLILSLHSLLKTDTVLLLGHKYGSWSSHPSWSQHFWFWRFHRHALERSFRHILYLEGTLVIPQYTVLLYIILYYFILHCTTLYYTILLYTTLYYILLVRKTWHSFSYNKQVNLPPTRLHGTFWCASCFLD